MANSRDSPGEWWLKRWSMVFETTIIVVAVIGVITLIGLVTARLGAVSSRATEEDWLDAPFLGIAVIVVLLQNGVYLGLPIRVSAWILALTAVGGMVVCARQGRFAGLLSSFPRGPLVLAIGIYVLHGLGLWVAGVESYLGRGWGDQVNYAALAYYLADYSLGLVPSTSEPAALLGHAYLNTRIGQSVLIGFFSVLVQSSPKILFEPVIILGPFLLTLAISEHGRQAGLPRGLQLLLAAFAGVLPAVAMVHLESFLSQALAIPALVYLPILLARALQHGRFADYLRAGLVLSATTAIYLEYVPLLACCVVVFVVVCCFRTDARQRHLLALAGVAALPFVLRTTQNFVELMREVGRPILSHIYPWAQSVEGIERLWAGDFVGAEFQISWVRRAFALGFLLLGYYGLLRQGTAAFTAAVSDAGVALSNVARSLSLLGFAVFPLVFLVYELGYSYHFYKSLLMAAPLLAWGGGYAIFSHLAPGSKRTRELVVTLCVVPLAGLSAAATADMVLASADPLLPNHEVVRRRQIANPHTLSSDFLAVERRLGDLSGRDVILCVSDTVWNQGHVNGWFALAGRQNRVWSLNPRLNDRQLPLLAGREYLRDMPSALDNSVVILSRSGGSVWASAEQRSFENVKASEYLMLELGTIPIALLCHPGIATEADGTAALTISGIGEQLVVFSNVAGHGVISLRVPDAHASQAIRVSVENQPVSALSQTTGAIQIPIALKAGATFITLSLGNSGELAASVQLTFDMRADDVGVKEEVEQQPH